MFGWQRGVLWLAQGFVLPWLITISIFLVGFLLGWFNSGLSDFSNGIETGRGLVLFGFLLSGGGASLGIIVEGGFPRWKTFIRFVGLTLGMVAYWQWLLPALSSF